VRDTFRGFGAVFYKETLHVRRDFGTLFFSLIIPLLQMLLLGYGIDTNIRQINTVVFNADGRRESRELIDRMKNSDTFHVVRYVTSDQDMNEMIIGGKARVGIKIPVDYSDKLLHQMSAEVLVLIDGSDSAVAGQAINVTNAIGLDESLRRVLLNNEAFAVEMRPKLLFNPDSRSPNFFLPGLTAILLLNVTTFLTAFSIVREKERGTLEQLFVTPVRPMGLLLGKLLPYLAIGFFELCMILTFMRFAFRVPIHGSVLLLAFLSLPYIFVSLSLGILISSKATPIGGHATGVFDDSVEHLFSGYIFPRETMPKFFYAISYFVPASYFINITRGESCAARESGICGSTRWPFRYGNNLAGDAAGDSRTKSSWRSWRRAEFQKKKDRAAAAGSERAEKRPLGEKAAAATEQWCFVFRAGGEYAARSFKFARRNCELSDLREA
jgi:ABC-2 type transport system permease protein